MHKKGLKLMTLLLAAVLCVSCLGETGMAAEGTSGMSADLSVKSQSVSFEKDAPQLQQAVACSKGTVQLTWNALSQADGYAVFRKTTGGSWKRIGTTTSTSYKDKSSLSNGKTYYYTVRAYRGKAETALKHTYSSSYWSSYDSAGVKIVYTEIPTLKASVTNTTAGIKIKWTKVSGANGYSIHRKTKNGNWQRIGTTTSASYTDKTAKAGTTYYYTVRAYRGDQTIALSNTYDAEYWSGYDSNGVKGRFLEAPTLNSKATASSSGIKVSWSKVSKADGYAVFRKTSGGSWKQIGTTTSTSYTDTSSLSNGKTYYYTVRAYRGKESSALKHKYSSSYWSAYDSAGVKIIYTAAPTIKKVSESSSGNKISWDKVSGASGYAVMRKTSGESWTRIATTTSTSYTDKTASSSKKYSYAVRAYRGNQATALANTYNALYWSGYHSSSSADLDMYNKAQGYSSSTKWLILVNSKTNKVGIFHGSKGNWELKHYWDCSTGKSSTPTKKGTFKVGSKGTSFNGSNYTCWYYTQFSGNYLFHSVLYVKGSKTKVQDGRLGENVSHGCVRLSISHAKWIYDNIPKNTTVVSY